MVNPVDIGLRIAQVLDSIGIKMGSYIGKGSNVKKAMFGGKPTMFKPNALEALRGTNANFDDALRLIENEAQFIVNATDAEKIAFLNNVNDYKQFGGPLKTDVVARTEFEQGLGSLKGDIEDLQSSTSDLLTTAKSMKDDAEKGLKSAEDDLKVFLETGGNPLKKEDKKFLGGSMHEEGQIRTGIRQFLQNELKNGRIKLDSMDTERVMKYFPTLEDDPILVFKKIYGDEAYKRAGTFPGAFEIGEDFNHYRTIFESKMGEDILKVKDKKYVGDGRLLLTESEEIRTPTPDDDDIPFAKGGIADVRPGFLKGKGVTKVKQIIEYITSKFTPIDAMKEVNKVIGKQGKYKNLKLTQKDIDEIVENTEDFIFQRDPDNKFVEGSIKEKTEYLDEDDVLERDLFKEKKEPDTQVFKDSEGGIKGITMGGDKKFKDAMSEAMEEGIRESENMKRLGLNPSKMEDALKYDEMKEAGQLEKNVTGSADLSPAEDLMKKYPGMTKELAEQIANDPDPARKAQVISMVEQTFKLSEQGKSGDEIIDIFKQGTDRTKQAKGGRAGYYGGGMTNMVEPDLSDIGHGSDALMGRTRLSAPGSQATTSTGLNYLLGEDNDNVRVPFNEGLLVPPKKPYTEEMFQDDSMTLLQGMYGTGKDSNEFLYNEMIKKGNKLRERGVERETVIEIIRNNKDKIDMILKQQTTSPKSLKGLAEGGRIGFAGGGADMGTVSTPSRAATAKSVNVSPSGSVTTSKTKGPDGPDDRGSPQQNLNHLVAMHKNQNPQPQESKLKNMVNTAQEVNYLRNLKNLDPIGLGISYGINKFGPSIMQKLKNLRSEAEIEEEDGIMQMVELTEPQLDYLNSKKTQRDLKEGFLSPQQIYDKLPEYEEKTPLNPFKGDQEPTSPKEFNEYLDTIDKNKFLERITVADGGIAGLRQGYAGGTLVDKGRRGFLKFLGGTAAGVVALKAGLVKMLGKESGAISKKAIDEVIIEGGSGAPAWLQPLVNKALRDGTDISKQAVKDGQVVKSLDTPTGKVDVYYDTRTGEIDIDYIGGNTALGESVNMRYVPGVADEGTQGIKPADEFEANEAIPEGRGYSYGDEYDYSIDVGENTTDNVKNLFSDTTELAELGGQKTLTKDIVETVKKKKVLKQMKDNPADFITDVQGDFVPD